MHFLDNRELFDYNNCFSAHFAEKSRVNKNKEKDKNNKIL